MRISHWIICQRIGIKKDLWNHHLVVPFHQYQAIEVYFLRWGYYLEELLGGQKFDFRPTWLVMTRLSLLVLQSCESVPSPVEFRNNKTQPQPVDDTVVPVFNEGALAFTSRKALAYICGRAGFGWMEKNPPPFCPSTKNHGKFVR